MKVTLGGDRLGSGNKNKQYLDNYGRSTHNLSQKFTSSMQVGTLYPFLVLPAMRGDKFTINLQADARTIPTKGPLFGSFKMQVDLFQCDVRLYQALLHNNPLHIGMNMKDVKFPYLELQDYKPGGSAFSNSSLLKYLGMSGIGHKTQLASLPFKRNVNAIPVLAYYEIFKTYYSNKQEENAYVIGTQRNVGNMSDFEFTVNNEIFGINTEFDLTALPMQIKVDTGTEPANGWQENMLISRYDDGGTFQGAYNFKDMLNRGYIVQTGTNIYNLVELPQAPLINPTSTLSMSPRDVNYIDVERGLEPFPLKNIDDMRLELLSYHELGSGFGIGQDKDWNEGSGTSEDGMPYCKLWEFDAEQTGEGQYNYTPKNCNPLNGLVVKTYQSDIYNNWVNTEWIDGENGIAEITAISTATGSIKIDSINLAEKLYNMLNRVAVSDGSYEGWQDAVYTETPRRHIESPVYLGGMSSEIIFEEIVQTSQGDAENPLGSLGGKGTLIKRKGGHVTVKCNEACFIIGIVSLTPRINYCQGNEFYMTDIMSMDDFHKPALDGIGFQNLIGERLAWWDTEIGVNGETSRSTIGKIPAWMEYMTAVDKCYGDFAETEGKGFMTLLRDYTRHYNEIQDATTYIDPRKYNYAFAVTDIEAQNFWVQIYSEIKARRLMSAKQIPNL